MSFNIRSFFGGLAALYKFLYSCLKAEFPYLELIFENLLCNLVWGILYVCKEAKVDFFWVRVSDAQPDELAFLLWAHAASRGLDKKNGKLKILKSEAVDINHNPNQNQTLQTTLDCFFPS